MKRLFIVIILNTFIVCNFAQVYEWVNLSGNLPEQTGLFDLHFINDTGWICGGKEKLFYTTNGGIEFTTQILPENSSATSLFMRNNNIGYTVTGLGKILSTTNSGKEWNIISSANVPLFSIHFPPFDSIGFTCGLNGIIYKINKDSTELDTVISNNIWSSICFPVSSEEGWVIGSNKIFHKISGEWIADQNYNPGYYNSIYFIDNLNGWAVGNAGVIIHTSDGKNWVNQTSTTTDHLFDVFFLNTQEGWAVGDNGRIIHTTDGGENWLIEAPNLVEGKMLRTVFAVSSNSVYAAGYESFIRFMQITGVNDFPNSSIHFDLSQNYPNPFNPGTVIVYKLPVSSFVTLQVYDLLGREVIKLVDEVKSAGIYEVEFNASSANVELPSGIYLYRIKAGNFTETRKMLLLR
jgi:photosystem II stability/assembly factor-like uncharacterized protein